LPTSTRASVIDTEADSPFLGHELMLVMAGSAVYFSSRGLGLSSLSPPSLSKSVTEPQCKHSVSVSSLAVPALAPTGPTAVLTAARRFPMPT
jgi:hypothetical protein